jgi:hypothetical protein
MLLRGVGGTLNCGAAVAKTACVLNWLGGAHGLTELQAVGVFRLPYE